MDEQKASAGELRVARIVKLVLALMDAPAEAPAAPRAPARGEAAAWRGIAEGLEIVADHAAWMAERRFTDLRSQP